MNAYLPLKRAQLNELLAKKQGELAQLRFDAVTGAGSSQLSNIRRIRRDIARINTAITLKTRKSALRRYRKEYDNRLPHDLRAKKTRALRRALTSEQKNAKSVRQQKKANAFPQRRFAVKA